MEFRNYKSYPEYKNSGVEWIGEVPGHWKLVPLKHLAFFINGYNFKPEDWSDEGIPIIRIENLNESNNFNRTNKQIPQKYHVKKGDLLFGWSGNRGTSFGIFIWQLDGIFYLNQHIFLVRLMNNYDTNKKWFYWALRATTRYIEQLAHGIIGMVHVTRSKLGSTYISMPTDHDEQETISKFLDYKNSKIDQLIQEKQELIELLKKKKTALITKCVTKGLDDNVKMKDSRVEWIGKIPEHWNIKKLKHILKIPLCYGANESGHKKEKANDVRLIRISDINNDSKIKNDDKKYLSLDIAKPYLLSHGDILFARSGATVGKTYLYNGNTYEACFAGYFIKATIDKFIGNPNFVNYFTKSDSYWAFIKSIFIQATIQNVSAEKYKNLLIPIPSLKEQNQIVSYLDEVISKIDQSIQEIQDSIDYLKRYRTSLITAAVTGKIDVRDWEQGEIPNKEAAHA